MLVKAENGGDFSDDNIRERDADGGRLLGRVNTWCKPEGLRDFDRLWRKVDSRPCTQESLKSTGREGSMASYMELC